MNEYCVVGNPIAHSKSPQIHAQFAKSCGRVIKYNKKLVEKHHFVETMTALFSKGLNGANVTVPFKAEAFELCDHISDRAQAAGAVNTIINTPDRGLLGDNTDGVGLARDLTQNHGIKLKDNTILVVGAGGATRGILKPILEEQPELVIIANRTHEKACELADIFKTFGNINSATFQELEQFNFDVILNATSSSLEGDVPPIPTNSIGSDCVFYDLMYANEATPFLLWGKELGLNKLYDGLGMLVEQAAESFYLWEGVRPDTKPVMNLLRAN